MGWHTCEYCLARGAPSPATSSGDVTLTLEYQGKQVVYEMPDMLPHYIEVHSHRPQQEFIDAVLYGRLVSGERWQTKSISPVQSVGYLSGDYQIGSVPPAFVGRLKDLMWRAAQQGERAQTRGGHLPSSPEYISLRGIPGSFAARDRFLLDRRTENSRDVVADLVLPVEFKQITKEALTVLREHGVWHTTTVVRFPTERTKISSDDYPHTYFLYQIGEKVLEARVDNGVLDVWKGH